MALPKLLTTEEAAARLGVHIHTLYRWRKAGKGPEFVRFGPNVVRYPEDTLLKPLAA